MKYFILIWAGLWRRKMRTIFTMLSVVVAFLLFGLLQGFNLGMDSFVNNLNASRLYTANKYSMVEGLPVALTNQIKSVEGVTHVSHWTFFGGFYRESKNALPAFATNAREMFTLYDEIELTPGALDRMEQTRNGVMMSRGVADRFGWEIGDTIPVGSSVWTKKDGTNNYQFEIIDIYEPEGNGGIASGFYFNYDFFDEARQFGNGTVHYFIIGVDDPRRGGEIASEIDALFANSTNETKTQTEQALAASQLKQVADIGFIVNSIVGAVLFTLLFLTGNSMMQSMRERIPELAILKTLGYSDAKVSLFVMIESIILCVFSALAGLALATYAFGFVAEVMGPVSMPPLVIGLGVLMAVLLAIFSGASPTWRAQRLNIVDALAGR